MNVIYTSRSPRPEAEKELNAKRVTFDELLRESDFVIVMTDLNPSTQYLFDRAAFQKMKRTAIFINSARGPLHRQADLIAALEAEEIFGAGLDVTDPEPLPPDDPLWNAPNLILTPHVSGSSGPAGLRWLAAHVQANLRREADGHEPTHQVLV